MEPILVILIIDPPLIIKSEAISQHLYVEIKLTSIELVQVDVSTLSVTAELGVSDGEAMLTYDVGFTLNV